MLLPVPAGRVGQEENPDPGVQWVVTPPPPGRDPGTSLAPTCFPVPVPVCLLGSLPALLHTADTAAPGGASSFSPGLGNAQIT